MIKFGLNVLQWLEYGETPIFNSFREEMIGNINSTIDAEFYLNYAHQCFIKMIHKKQEQYQLNELLSLKLYTDTTSYQSALRKAFWKNWTTAKPRTIGVSSLMN